MERNIRLLESTLFDVAIIGGGITGACIAHDAALRGLRVALVEKNDFGMSTSSASSKLLHGGIRYLQKLQFKKVRESARERTWFQIIAPHLTRNIPFLVPTIEGDLMKGRGALIAGMTLYHLICSGLNGRISDPAKKVERGRFHRKDRLLNWVPLLANIPGINGAHTLYEIHMNSSERMTLAFVKTAVQNGAVVANYAEVEGFCAEGGRICGISCRDTLNGCSFSVSAKMIVNAAGPFLPGINNLIAGLRLHKNTTGFSKGVHLVTRQIEAKYALALSSGKKTEGLVTRGGRHIFVIPWRGRSLIGTTNVPFDEDLDNVRVTRQDIDDFLQDINAIIPGVQLTKGDVYYAFAGLYPLISDEIKTDTYQGTGEYQVVDHAKNDKLEGIISVLGAKYTTARAIAEQAVDVIVKKNNGSGVQCKTATTPLFEGNIKDMDAFIADRKRFYHGVLPGKVVEDLIVSHGSNLDRVVDFLSTRPEYMTPLSPDRETLVGEVAYAVEQEMARHLDDVLFARTGLGTIGHPGQAVVEKTSTMMAELLGWSEERRQVEIAAVENRYSYDVQ